MNELGWPRPRAEPETPQGNVGIESQVLPGIGPELSTANDGTHEQFGLFLFSREPRDLGSLPHDWWTPVHGSSHRRRIGTHDGGSPRRAGLGGSPPAPIVRATMPKMAEPPSRARTQRHLPRGALAPKKKVSNRFTSNDMP